jgi:hypothetical protein
MTMVELLVTLAILSGVMVAVATWTRAASSICAAAATQVRERAAIDAALLRIEEDVLTGDFEEPRREARRADRVALDGDALVIRTRGEDAHGAVGQVTHRHSHDAGELRCLALGRDGSRLERLLADDVASVTWSIEETEEREGDKRRILSVRIEGSHGQIGERRFVLP